MESKHEVESTSAAADLIPAFGYRREATTSGIEVSRVEFNRRAPRPTDIVIDIHYCGMCHTDLLYMQRFKSVPIVAGHEIAGIVRQVGDEAGKVWKVGERVGVGYFTDSCRTCKQCMRSRENYCKNNMLLTFCGKPAQCAWIPRPEEIEPDNPVTMGGFSSVIVVDYRYATKIPEAIALARAGPLLCAGVTVYAPLKMHGAGPGVSVGVMGLGGLGHLAVKIAKVRGASVTVFSTSDRKRQYALETLGVDRYVVSSSQDDLDAAKQSIDLVIDTVGEPHQPEAFFDTLESGATWHMVGVFSEHIQVLPSHLYGRNIRITGSLVGSPKDSQEMMDFCGKHNIAPDVEVVPFDTINDVLAKLERSELPPGKSRYVLDIIGAGMSN